MKIKQKCLSTVLFCLIILIFSACKKEENNEAPKTYKEDTVFAVNGEEVSMGEWNLYARPTIADIDKMYGKEIWDFKMDSEGKLFGESLKEDIRDRIVSVKLIASKAKELGVALTEDDKNEVALATDEYMEQLSSSLMKKYGITEELVNKVYSDNMLATKVYEHLTLNVDTETDEKEVRHMQLRYIMYSKSYENREGETVFHSDEEITLKRNELISIKDKISNSDTLTLKDAETDELVVTDIIADLADLKERLPEEEAGVVFWLRKNELSPLIETDEALFLFECVKITDEDSTNAARVKVIEQREQQVFGTEYAEWIKNVEVENNEAVWNLISLSD